MNIETRLKIEKQIASRIIKDALSAGYSVSVYDGEEYAIKRSRKYTDILNAIQGTDQDSLIMRDSNGNRIGVVFLVYGNDGFDVISDYSANDVMESLLQGAQTLADKLEAKYY